MQGMPSLWNMSRFRGSSSKASRGSKPNARSSATAARLNRDAWA